MGKKDKDKKEESKANSNATNQNSKDNRDNDNNGRILNTIKEISLQPVNAIDDFDYDTQLFKQYISNTLIEQKTIKFGDDKILKMVVFGKS